MFKIGDTVKRSAHALQPARDHWQRQGEASRKAQAKREYEEAAARRGTVTATTENGLSVLWKDGYTSTGLSYMYEKAEEARP